MFLRKFYEFALLAQYFTTWWVRSIICDDETTFKLVIWELSELWLIVIQRMALD